MRKKLSPTMKEHLITTIPLAGGPGAKVRCRPPFHHENLRTYEALVRRGLLRVDAEGYTEVTPEGHAEATRRE